MQLKDKTYYKFILIWSGIHISINLLLFFIRIYVIDDESNSFNDFFYLSKYVLLQILIFTSITMICKFLLNERRVVYFSFPIIQSIILHFLFLKKLKLTDDGCKFTAEFFDFEVKYLEMNLQEFSSILLYYFPFTGIFESGFYVPDNTIYSYLLLVFSIVIYYFIITIFSFKVSFKSD